MEEPKELPRRTCRGRPIVCPGPCNPRYRICPRRESLRRRTLCAEGFPVCSVIRAIEEDLRAPPSLTLDQINSEQLREDPRTLRPIPQHRLWNLGGTISKFNVKGLKAALRTTRTSVFQATKLASSCLGTGLRFLRGTKVPGFLYTLFILVIYAGFHGLVAGLSWFTPGYQIFLSSQICGIAAVLVWSVSGTIPI